MSVSRRTAVTIVLAFSVVGAPSAAWGHGLHYIGTLEVTGNGTVTATTGQGVTGTEALPGGTVVDRAGGCAGSPTSTWYGGHFDQGYNWVGTPPVREDQGCVDVHTTTGSASAPFNGSVTISGSGFRPGTTFGVTYLYPNDEGDLDGDTEGAQETDTNDPFCHRTYFQNIGILASFTTSGSVSNATPNSTKGNFSGVSVPLGASSVGLGQLCITSPRFQYKGPAPTETGPYEATSQGQSVPLTVL